MFVFIFYPIVDSFIISTYKWNGIAADKQFIGLANYVGAIAINRREGLVGLTSPNGGRFVTLDAATGRVLKDETVADAAGIAPAPHGFAVSSYDGRFAGRRVDLAWDQHTIAL